MAELPLIFHLSTSTVEAELPPAVEVNIPAEAGMAPNPEQVRATEAVFAEGAERGAAAGLLGLWTCAMLAHDLTLETFGKPAGEFEEEELEKLKRKDRFKATK
jgi:hypothetical protein